jgi:hypothetical protein
MIKNDIPKAQKKEFIEKITIAIGELELSEEKEIPFDMDAHIGNRWVKYKLIVRKTN